jgi:hypothetical protein
VELSSAFFRKIASMADDLIVDLRETAVEPESAPLAMLWGAPYSDKTDKLMALVGLGLKSVKVIGGSKEANKLLGNAGYTVVPMVKSWMELQDAESELVVADHAALAESKAQVADVIALKKSEGKSVVSLNCVTAVGVEDLKGGAKYALSPLAAAISLLS